jgi:hypothetical protein
MKREAEVVLRFQTDAIRALLSWKECAPACTTADAREQLKGARFNRHPTQCSIPPTGHLLPPNMWHSLCILCVGCWDQRGWTSVRVRCAGTFFARAPQISDNRFRHRIRHPIRHRTATTCCHVAGLVPTQRWTPAWQLDARASIRMHCHTLPALRHDHAAAVPLPFPCSFPMHQRLSSPSCPQRRPQPPTVNTGDRGPQRHAH